MLRRLVLLSVLGVVGIAGVTLLPASADAHPLPGIGYQHDRFAVLYRGHHGWREYGSYYNRFQAERVAEHLRCRGFFVEVRGC